MNRYSERARLAFHFAQSEADSLGENVVGVEHLLLGLLRQQTTASAALNGAGVTLGGTRRKVKQLAARGERVPERPKNEMTPELEAVTRLVDEMQTSPVEPEHLLLALLEHGSENLQDLIGDIDGLRRRLSRDAVGG